jgi:outer membrane lipoprotein-sorting protein
MRSIVTFRISAGLMFLCLAVFAPAVSSDDAGDLTTRVANIYSNLGNYYVSGVFKLTTTVMGSSQDIEAPFIQAGRSPGRMRMEIQHDILGSLVVSDGEAMWTYFKATGQYKKDASVPIDRGGEKPGATVMGPGGSFLGMYGTIDNEDVSVRPDGYAEIEFGGGTVRCAVLRLVHAPADTAAVSMGPDSLFVDPETARVLKSVHNVDGEVQGMAMKTRKYLTRLNWMPSNGCWLLKQVV